MKIVNSGLIAFSGSDLKDYINSELQSDWKMRDFVEIVQSHCKNESKRILLVSGLRSTGKTVGILQGIPVAETLYISPVSKYSVKADEVLRVASASTCRVVVIDECSWVDGDKDTFIGTLAGLAKTGKKVILTGTESTFINSLPNGVLIHRARVVHTTFFSYDEYCRLFRLENSPNSMNKYLTFGGIFEFNRKDKYVSIREYVETAIFNNIVSYYPNLDSEKVKLAIYEIFYDCICKSYNLNLHVYNHLDRNTVMSCEEFLETFGIDPSISVDESTFKVVSHLLESIDVVITVRDLRLQNHYRTYLTNQALSAQLMMVVFQLDSLAQSEYGKLFEASVVCDFYKKMPDDCEMFFLEGRKSGIDFEIDFIIKESVLNVAYLFECKHSSNDDYRLSIQSSIVNRVIPNILGDTEICGRYVIYQGNPKTENVNGYDVVFTSDWGVINSFESFEEHKNVLNRVMNLGNKSFAFQQK